VHIPLTLVKDDTFRTDLISFICDLFNIIEEPEKGLIDTVVPFALEMLCGGKEVD